jgi:hypothetical protein
LRFQLGGGIGVENFMLSSAPALLRGHTVADVSHKLFQRAEEKRAETTFFAVSPPKRAIADEIGEETLGKVLRVLRADTLAPQKKIERPPINLAEFGEGLVGVGRRDLRVAGRENESPPGRLEGILWGIASRGDGVHCCAVYLIAGEMTS